MDRPTRVLHPALPLQPLLAWMAPRLLPGLTTVPCPRTAKRDNITPVLGTTNWLSPAPRACSSSAHTLGSQDFYHAFHTCPEPAFLGSCPLTAPCPPVCSLHPLSTHVPSTVLPRGYAQGPNTNKLLLWEVRRQSVSRDTTHRNDRQRHAGPRREAKCSRAWEHGVGVRAEGSKAGRSCSGLAAASTQALRSEMVLPLSTAQESEPLSCIEHKAGQWMGPSARLVVA